MPAPPRGETGNPTFTPCTHEWWTTDGWDPYYDELIPWSDPRAQAAFDRGYVQGLADLDAMRHSKP